MINHLKRFFCKDLYSEIDSLNKENSSLKKEITDSKVKNQDHINQTNRYYKGILRKNNIRL